MNIDTLRLEFIFTTLTMYKAWKHTLVEVDSIINSQDFIPLPIQEKIEFLEGKVSLNLDENLYSELLSLRNQLKSG